MTPSDFINLPAHAGLLVELAGGVFALGGAVGAVLNLYYGTPKKSWREQRAAMFWSVLTMVASVSVALLTFGHHRARVTADWGPFEGELFVSVVLFVVFMGGLVVAWNALRLKGPEGR